MDRLIEGVYIFYIDKDYSNDNNDPVKNFAEAFLVKIIGTAKITSTITPKQEQDITNGILKLRNSEILYMINFLCDHYYNLSGNNPEVKAAERILANPAFNIYRDIILFMVDDPDDRDKSSYLTIQEYEKKLNIKIFYDEKDYISVKQQRKMKLEKIFNNE